MYIWNLIAVGCKILKWKEKTSKLVFSVSPHLQLLYGTYIKFKFRVIIHTKST